MMQENIVNMLNQAGVLQEHRPIVCRIISRVIFGLGSYRTERRRIVNVKDKAKSLVNPEIETKIWAWMRDLFWDRSVMTCYWRALGYAIYHRDFSEAALHYDVRVADLMFLFDQLNYDDIQEFTAKDRKWRSNPISDQAVKDVLDSCRGAISSCVYRLRFVWKYDQGHPKEEWHSFFVSEAIQTIYMYEERHSFVHLVNTVRNALDRKCGIMQQRFSTVKRGSLINSDLLGGSSVQAFVSRVVPLMITSNVDGESIENPELFHRATRIDSEIDTNAFISRVGQQSKQLERYLKIVVQHEDDPEFNQHLDDSQADVGDDRDLAIEARRFCQLTKGDMAALRQTADIDYPILRYLHERKLKADEERRRAEVAARRNELKHRIGVRHR